MKAILLVVLVLFVSAQVFSQKNDSTNFKCGDEEYTKYLEKTNPQFYKLYKEKLNSITSANLGITLDTTTVYTIPVIFRIYHLGEAVGVGSNLSESNVKLAINSLNQAFRGVGRFEGLTVDTKIEFVLASRKPDGTATNGIERIDGRVVVGYEANGLTSFNTSPFDALGQHWDSHYYRINHYHLITVAAGFAGYNSNSFHLANYTNGEGGWSYVLSHEAGHTFGLPHTFEGDGDNQYCPVNNNPDVDGDGINDTDPHKKNTGSDSSAINPCTGRSFGRVIHNIMSYTSARLFTQRQKEKMRFNLISFQPNLINSPALLLPNSNPIALIPSCTIANSSGLGYERIKFKLNNLNFSYTSGNQKYTNYTKFYPAESLIAGQNQTIIVQPSSTNVLGALRLYFDFNNDGDFDDANENPINVSGNILPIETTYNIVIPANAVTSSNIRMRFLYGHAIPSGALLNACTFPTSTSSGMAADFSIKILPNCRTVTPPIVASISVPNGQSATLQATNCTGTIKWYDIDQNYIQSGNSFTVNNIQRVYHYYTTCTEGTCESISSTKASITPTYSIVLNSVSPMCTGTASPISFTHNFPADTYFTLVLRRAGKILKYTYDGRSFNINPYNFTPTYDVPYANDYSFKIISNQTQSNVVNNVAIGNLSNSITDGFVTVPSFANADNSYLGGYDYLCTGASKNLFGKIVKTTTSNIISEITEGLTYQWKKDGVNFGINQNPITVNQAGNYQLQAIQGGCVLNSNSTNLSFTTTPSVYFSDQPSELSLCEGTQYILAPNYNSNTATFQWKKNGVDILGAITRTLSVTTSGLYSVRVLDGVCNRLTSNVKLNFGTSLKPSLYYTDTLLCNSSIYFNANTGGNVGTFNYQWQKDGINIPNSTLNYCYVSNPGSYRLMMSHGNCSSFSKEVSIVNDIKKQKPVLSTYGSLNICSGSISTNFNNQYCTLFKDNTAIFTGYYYDITQSGTYKLKTSPTDNSCANESDPVVISIGTSLVPIIKQEKIYYTNSSLKNLPALCGLNDYVFLSFQQSSTGTYSYQWQKNGVDIPNSSYNGFWVSSIGDYRVRVTNGTCTAYSNIITVTQGNGSNAKIITDDNNLECSNRLAQLELVDGHSSNINWYRNGVLIPNENSTKLFVNAEGNYTVNFNNNNGCAATTPPITINSKFVSKPFTIPVSIIVGQNTTLTASGCNGSVAWYDAIKDGTLLGVGSQFITPTLNTSTFYFPSCTVNGCRSSRTSTLVSVNPCTIMYTLKTGNWNTTTTWSCGRTPLITDDVTISTGHTVTIPVGQTGFLKNLILNGTVVNSQLLKFKSL